MESATIAAQGYRFRVPYGTLLCVSDKPLHGEIKLPGQANKFYEEAIAAHLQIGLEAVKRLRDEGDRLHSRKLRAFNGDLHPFLAAATGTGKGVGFFLTGSGARLQLGRKSSVNLEAPGAGVMAGLLFHASRTGAKAALHQIMSENAQNLVGTIYLPTGELRIDGSAQIGAQAAYTAIVAETVRIFGGPHVILNSNYEETDVPVPVGIKGTGQPIALVN